MVQAKHHKSKPKKQVHVKKRGKPADITEFRSQLDALGLKIVNVTADGNCFFRALADQLEGNEEEHEKYRLRVVKYIQDHREEFEPFIEDDVPFDEYCQSMEKDGTWAGNMELQAASLVTHSNICIHRVMSPRWYIRNFDDRSTQMIHLSYHNEEHYNSLRMKDDTCTGPANPILIKADADLSVTTQKAKHAVTKSKGSSCRGIIDTRSIKLMMAGTGCQNTIEVEQVLQRLDGDVDAAIEFLIAKKGADDDHNDNGDPPLQNDTPAIAGHNENEECEQPGVIPQEETCENDREGPDNSDVKSSHDDKQSHYDHKKIPRNKVCPCGSKKKHKACCGSVKGKPSTEFVINQRVAFGKYRKERKQGRKGGATKVAPAIGSESDLPDMGALCI